MSVDKAVENIQEAIDNLEEADASEDAIEILDRMQHQLQGCNLVGKGRIDSDGRLYKGIRKCNYREK